MDLYADYKKDGIRIIEDNIDDFVVGGIFDPLDGAYDLLIDAWTGIDDFVNDAVNGDEDVERLLVKFVRKGIDNMTLNELMTANELRRAYQDKFRAFAASIVELSFLDEYAEAHQKEIGEELWRESQNPKFAQF